MICKNNKWVRSKKQNLLKCCYHNFFHIHFSRKRRKETILRKWGGSWILPSFEVQKKNTAALCHWSNLLFCYSWKQYFNTLCKLFFNPPGIPPFDQKMIVVTELCECKLIPPNTVSYSARATADRKRKADQLFNMSQQNFSQSGVFQINNLHLRRNML